MKRIAVLIAVLMTTQLMGQKYSLDKVLELALEHNHNVKVFENNVVIAENNADRGNAGMLPQLDLNGGVNYSNTNTKVELLAQPEPVTIEQDGAQSLSANLGVNLNWVLFDGMAMFRTYDRLKILVDLEDVRTRASVENTLMQVIQAYYQMASAENNLKVTRVSLDITRDRMERAKSKFDVGGSSSIDYLSAVVDLNTDSVTYVNTLAGLQQAANNLNQLTGYQLPEGFEVEDQIDLVESLNFGELTKMASTNNAQLLNAEYSKISAMRDYQIQKSTYMPTLALTGQYGLNYQENEVGNLLNSRNLGYGVGVSLSYPIFQANQRKIRAQNAKVNLLSSEEQRLNSVDQLRTDLNNAWVDYQTNLVVVEMEQRNLVNAQSNFDRTRELYQLGKVTNVQFRDAQLNFLRSQITIVNSKYSVRLSEFELIRLSGLLIQRDAQ